MCIFLDIPIVHISGGDTSLGSKDETLEILFH